MKIYQDLLLLKGFKEKEKLDFLKKVKETLPANWIFQKTLIENYEKNSGLSAKNILVVLSPEIKSKKANIWLRATENAIEVINIVPVNSKELSFDEYNTILNEFLDNCILSVQGYENIPVEMSLDDISLQEILPSNVYQLLCQWEIGCNKDTGNTHPIDEERWLEFLISLHKAFGSQFDYPKENFIEIFKRWLLEEKKEWDNRDDVVYKLIRDLEYGLELLEKYDNN